MVVKTTQSISAFRHNEPHAATSKNREKTYGLDIQGSIHPVRKALTKHLLATFLSTTAIALAMPVEAMPMFDATTMATAGGNSETDGFKTPAPTNFVESSSSASDGPSDASAYANASDTGFVFAEAGVSAATSEGAYFHGDAIPAAHGLGKATYKNSFTNNTGSDANFALAITLPDHQLEAANSLLYDNNDVFSTNVTTTWMLDGNTIWQYSFGLETGAGAVLNQTETSSGTGAFPTAACSFIGPQAASCMLDDNTGLIDLGTILNGQTFELMVMVVAEAWAPGKNVPNIADPNCGGGCYLADQFGGVFGTTITLGDPAQLLPEDPNFIITSGATPSVPEPGTLAIFGLGLAGLAFARRKRKG